MMHGPMKTKLFRVPFSRFFPKAISVNLGSGGPTEELGETGEYSRAAHLSCMHMRLFLRVFLPCAAYKTAVDKAASFWRC